MYILSGVMSFISEYYPDNGTISVMVSNYGDNYKNAPDGATIKKFMEQFGDEIFNAADFDPQALLIAAAGTLKELASDEQSSSEISYLVQQIMNPATGIPSQMKQMRR